MAQKIILTNYYTRKKMTIPCCCPSCGEKWKWEVENLNEVEQVSTPWWYCGDMCIVDKNEPHSKLRLYCPKCHFEMNIEYSDYKIVDEILNAKINCYEKAE